MTFIHLRDEPLIAVAVVVVVVMMMGISPRRGPGTDIHIYIYQYQVLHVQQTVRMIRLGSVYTNS